MSSAIMLTDVKHRQLMEAATSLSSDILTPLQHRRDDVSSQLNVGADVSTERRIQIVECLAVSYTLEKPSLDVAPTDYFAAGVTYLQF